MANRNLHRKFAQEIVRLPVLTATVIEKGDLIQEDGTGRAQPASSEAWNSTVAQTRDDFKSAFVGVAQEPSANGETAEIAIATAGVFEYDCASTAWDYGDLVGSADDAAAGVALDDQNVESSALAGAIGEIVKTYDVATTRVLVRIFTHGRHDAP